jgi:hypothetical protein
MQRQLVAGRQRRIIHCGTHWKAANTVTHRVEQLFCTGGLTESKIRGTRYRYTGETADDRETREADDQTIIQISRSLR